MYCLSVSGVEGAGFSSSLLGVRASHKGLPRPVGARYQLPVRGRPASPSGARDIRATHHTVSERHAMWSHTRTYLIILRARDGAYVGAVLDVDRRRVLDVHQASDGDEMRPQRLRPFGSRSKRACQTGDILPRLNVTCTPPVLALTRARGVMR